VILFRCTRRGRLERLELELEPHARHQKGGGGPGGGGGGGGGPAGGGGAAGGPGGQGGGGGFDSGGVRPSLTCPNCVNPLEVAEAGITDFPDDEEDPYYPGWSDFIKRGGVRFGGGGGTSDPGGGGGGSVYVYGGGGGVTYPGGGLPGLNPGTGQPPGGGSPSIPSFTPPSARAAGLPAFGDVSFERGVNLELLRKPRPPSPTPARPMPSEMGGREFKVPGGFDLPPDVAFARRLERTRYQLGKGEIKTEDPLVKLLRDLFGILLPI